MRLDPQIHDEIARRAARVLDALDLLGVFVFATSGALAARAAGLDLFGVVVLASVVAVGGGTIRDVLLDRHPIFWVADARPLLVVLAAVAATLAWSRVLPVPTHALLLADAFGLALFAMSGARMADVGGHSWLVVVLAGTLSGTGGGVLRDVLTDHVVLLLRQDIYATAAIVGIVAYLLLQRAGVSRRVAFGIGLVVIVATRLAAIRWHLSLPAV